MGLWRVAGLWMWIWSGGEGSTRWAVVVVVVVGERAEGEGEVEGFFRLFLGGFSLSLVAFVLSVCGLCRMCLLVLGLGLGTGDWGLWNWGSLSFFLSCGLVFFLGLLPSC
jgi:hypothetical protein